MRITACSFAVFALLVCLSCSCYADDNPASVDNDTKLYQVVSYECKTKRLYAITDDLRETSGLEIRCGVTPDDWQVRDIPVIVCAKDVVLQDLLLAIAAATHVSFRARGLEKGKIIYRFTRDRRTQWEIDEWPETNKRANRAVAKWAWDTLATYGGMPQKPSEPSKDPERSASENTEIALASNLVASLGAGVRDRLMSGEPISLGMSDVPNPNALKKLFLYISQHSVATGSAVEPTEQEMEGATLRLALDPYDWKAADENSVGMQCLVDGVPYEEETENGTTARRKESFAFNPVDYASTLAEDSSLDLPSRPDLWPHDTSPSPDMKPLRTPEDWSSSSLETKVKLDDLKEKKNPAIGDLISALSKASGFSIVFEDFRSHKLAMFSHIEGDFSKEMSISDVLNAMNVGVGRVYGLKWFVNEKKKILVGWDANWRERHVGLVPESTLKTLYAKMNGEGAELDDIIPIFKATRRQFSDWFYQTDEFRHRISMTTDDWMLWRYYADMNPDDRNAAQGQGLLLVAQDPVAIAKYFQTRLVNSQDLNNSGDAPHHSELEVLLKPEVVSSMVMRIVTAPAEKPGPLKKHAYRIELEGARDGDKVRLVGKLNSGLTFPLYTLEREEALANPQPEKTETDTTQKEP